ncbi:hypothetical protein [Microbacterium sp. EST19A]|uniref:hypothetical protein n=1 Tax=Microbacterium sp. EST19A TaxID=2862681 RepID=UPI001CBAA9C0|nr:hypothetical protein [Microbacterium sp. EST19A]
MIPAFVLKIVLLAVALVVVVVFVRSLFARPSQAKARDARIRLPRYVAITAAALVGLGLFASVLGFGSGDMRDPVPFRIASVVLVAAGLVTLLVYRNWYVAPGVDAVAFRTVFGAERVIRYRDIVSHRTSGKGRRRMLVVKSSTGTTLRVNTSAYDMAPLLAVVEALTPRPR